MIKKNLVIIYIIACLVLVHYVSYAQSISDYWYFGNNAGLHFVSGNPVVVNDGQIIGVMGQGQEGCATMSDLNGNLLFYTDGKDVWDMNHSKVTGTSGNPVILQGSASSTQSAIITPRPSTNNQYYIFTIGAWGAMGSYSNGYYHGLGIHCYTVTVSPPPPGNPTSISISTGTLLPGITGDSLCEKITAVCKNDANGNFTGNYWLVAHGFGTNINLIDISRNFYVWEINNSGNFNNLLVTTIGSSHTNGIEGVPHAVAGYLKASPLSNKVALACSGGIGGIDGFFEVFDFNSMNGAISNAKLFADNINFYAPYGIEFSPSGRYLYCSTIDRLFRFDLLNNNVRVEIANSFQISALQLAKNGVLYIGRPGAYLNRINGISNPDAVNASIDITIPLSPTNYCMSGLPNFVQCLIPSFEVPTVNCPEDQQRCTDQAGYLVIGNEFDPTFTSSGASISNDFNSGSTLAGSIFPIGQTIVTWTANYNGITSTCSFTVTVDATPVIIFNSAGPFCKNDPADNLFAFPSGGFWSGNGITDANLGTFDPSIVNAGSQNIIYNIVTPCPSSRTINIEVNPLPNASASYKSALCTGDDLYLYAGGGVSYQWSGPGITGSNAYYQNPVIPNANSATYTVTVTDANGCSATAPVSVTTTPCCPDNNLLNGGFGQGIDIGSNNILDDQATVNDWHTGIGTPEIFIDDGCENIGWVQMKCNEEDFETVQQSVSLMQGIGYKIHFCARLNSSTTFPADPFVYFKFRASNTPILNVSDGTLIGISAIIPNTVWAEFDIPCWTADKDYTIFTVNVSKNNSGFGGSYYSIGDIDNICVEECCIANQTTNSLVINTGYNHPLGPVLPVLNSDGAWRIVNRPNSINFPVPYSAWTIAKNRWWSNPLPNSQWISAINNCYFYPNNPSPTFDPFTFEYCFCLCKPDWVTINFDALADDEAKFYLDSYLLSASFSNNTPINVQNITYLSEGIHYIRGEVRNLQHVAMGLDISGTVSTLYNSLKKWEYCDCHQPVIEGPVYSNPSAPGGFPAGIVPISCNGGNNGEIIPIDNPGFTYSWNTGSTSSSLSNLSSDTYSVTITDSYGQMANDIFVLQDPPLLNTFSSASPSICQNSTAGFINLSVTGGTSPYTYLWSNGATSQNISGLAAGPYSVTVTDANGCATTATSTITSDPPVTPIFTQLGPYSIGSTTTALPLTSNDGITGTWSPAVINTSATGTAIYTYTPTAGLCASPTTMSVTITAPISLVGTSQDIGTAVLAYWPAVSGAGIYVLQYSPFGSTGAWIGIGSNTNYVKIGNLTPGQHYECRVKAYYSSGSPLPGLQTGNFIPTPCTYVKDYDMGSTLKVNWDDYSPWASSYVFQYKKKVGGTSWLNNPSYLPYYNINTEPGVSYVCQVVVYKGGALWGTANAGEFTADPYSSSFAVSNGGTVVDLNWTDFNLNDPSSSWVVSQYLKYRSAGSTGPWIQKYYAGGTYTAHLTGLTPNSSNEFQIQVYLPSYWGTTPLGYFNTGVPKVMNANNTKNSINIYPNPFTDQVIMEMFTEQETQVLWNIYDITGRLVLSGNERITSCYTSLTVDAARLSGGIYMLNAMLNNEKHSFRLLKQ